MANTEEVLRQFNQAVSSGNVGGLSSLFADNLKHNLDRSGKKTGLSSSSALGTAAGNVGNANVKVLDQIVAGDQIVTRFQFEVDGANVDGAVAGSKATVTALCVAKVQDGKVVEANIEQDTAGMLLALGMGVADAPKQS